MLLDCDGLTQWTWWDDCKKKKKKKSLLAYWSSKLMYAFAVHSQPYWQTCLPMTLFPMEIADIWCQCKISISAGKRHYSIDGEKRVGINLQWFNRFSRMWLPSCWTCMILWNIIHCGNYLPCIQFHDYLQVLGSHFTYYKEI